MGAQALLGEGGDQREDAASHKPSRPLPSALGIAVRSGRMSEKTANLVKGAGRQIDKREGPGCVIVKGLHELGSKDLNLRHVAAGHRAEEAQAVSEVNVRGSPSPTSCPHSCGCLTRVIMPRAPKRRRYMFEEDLDSESEAQGLVGAQIPEAKEEEATSFPSCSCCSHSSSSPSSSPSSSSSSSSCCSCLVSGYIKARSAATGTPRPPQLPQRACFLPNVTAVTPSAQLCQGCSSQEEEGPDTLQALPDTGSLLREAIDDRADALVRFLLQKYRAEEPTTQVEMLSIIIREHEDHFAEILSQASLCLQLVFGVDVKEVDPSNHSYVLVTTLGLTYNGMGSDEHSMPKTGLLINILGVIFMHGNRAPEEAVWEALNDMGLHDGVQHSIYGESRGLITKVWVQEQYLQYRQVPNSDPARYEFRWGLRAHAETSKMKILEFLAKVTNTIPKAFPTLYEEALRDEEERSQARIVVRVNEVARSYSTATFSTFSCLKSEENNPCSKRRGRMRSGRY
ncbi:melanoma-associated antigen 10-like [Rhinolophus sinicus]|uniref:melanoma-associated antigen 10-like n=1 Tax=Rhinolophus sinicus TaxID=89399 RepID=UPI003D7A4EDD